MSNKVFIKEFNNRFHIRNSNINPKTKYIYTTKSLIDDHLPYWIEYTKPYISNSKPFHMLEIGSFQGQSATWFLDNLMIHPKSTLTCVDPFFTRKTIDDKAIFLHNINTSGRSNQTIIKEGLSGDILPKLLNEGKEYDIIYVDGSHEYKETLEDCMNSWKLLKKKGLLIIDDYRMNPVFATDKVGPKPAIDDFLNYLETTQQRKFQVLDTNFMKPRSKLLIGYQVQIRKLN